jgi:hypothetical protein
MLVLGLVRLAEGEDKTALTEVPTLPTECPALIDEEKKNPDAVLEDPVKVLSLLKCSTALKNRKQCANKPDVACGQIVIAPTTKDPADPQTVSLDTQNANVVDVSDPSAVAKVSGMIAASVVGAKTGDPAATILAGGAGTYSCDQYVKAAARKDPLLIAYPSAIPTIALAKDTKDAVDQTMRDLQVRGVVAAGAAPIIIPIATFKVATRVIAESPAIITQVVPVPAGGGVKTVAAAVAAPVVAPPVVIIKTGGQVAKKVTCRFHIGHWHC